LLAPSTTSADAVTQAAPTPPSAGSRRMRSAPSTSAPTTEKAIATASCSTGCSVSMWTRSSTSRVVTSPRVESWVSAAETNTIRRRTA